MSAAEAAVIPVGSPGREARAVAAGQLQDALRALQAAEARASSLAEQLSHAEAQVRPTPNERKSARENDAVRA